MALEEVMLEVVLVVSLMLGTAALALVGPRRIASALRGYRWRAAAIAAPVALLTVVLVARVATRDVLTELSKRVVGIRITSEIFRLERTLFETNPVVFLQSFESAPLTSYFGFVYVYGYVFLLTFPLIAYFALEEMDDLRTLLVAYATNYGIGVALYTLFIAFGPRNYDPIFENLFYGSFPQARFLTDEVNENTNVFPSLHASLSITVAMLSWQTREKYPLWVPIASLIGASVVVSTMYLGIHWFSDVAAGAILAAASVYVGRNYSVGGAVVTVRTGLARWRGDRDGVEDAAGTGPDSGPESRPSASSASTAPSDGAVDRDAEPEAGPDSR